MIIERGIDGLQGRDGHEIGGRQDQQDFLVSLPERGIFVVADGMGGHPNGDKASRIAAETLARELSARPEKWLQAWTRARRAVAKMGGERRFSRKMPGTTLTAVQFVAGGRGHSRRVRVLHVGDSAAYRIGAIGETQRLTEQHGVGHYVDRAILCDMDDPGEDPDVRIVEVYPGDRLLLATDGVTGPIGTDPMPVKPYGRQTLSEGASSLREYLPASMDNFTFILIEV